MQICSSCSSIELAPNYMQLRNTETNLLQWIQDEDLLVFANWSHQIALVKCPKAATVAEKPQEEVLAPVRTRWCMFVVACGSRLFHVCECWWCLGEVSMIHTYRLTLNSSRQCLVIEQHRLSTFYFNINAFKRFLSLCLFPPQRSVMSIWLCV